MVMVAKKAAPLSTGEFDRASILTKLFALPVPPPPVPSKGKRTYPIDTPLGRIMRHRGLTINEVCSWPGAPNARRMSDFLAGRHPIPPHHKIAIARGLKIDPRLL